MITAAAIVIAAAISIATTTTADTAAATITRTSSSLTTITTTLSRTITRHRILITTGLTAEMMRRPRASRSSSVCDLKPLAGSGLIGPQGHYRQPVQGTIFGTTFSPRMESNYASIARTENGIAL